MKINVHIERVILEGLPVSASQAPRIREGVENELTRLLAVRGLPHILLLGGAFPELAVEDLQLARVSNPRKVGREIARSVYKGVGQ
jgi:hypothetical protein